MDRKYTIAVASAAAAMIVVAVYLFGRKKTTKESTKKPVKEESMMVDSVKVNSIELLQEVDGTVNVSDITTTQDAMARGLEEMKKKQYLNAIAYFTKGIKIIGMTDLECRMNFFLQRSQANVDADRMSSAIVDLTEVITLFPLNPAPYMARGEMYTNIGQELKALRDYVMVSLLEGTSEQVSQQSQQIVSILQNSIGSKKAKEEIERRNRDSKYKLRFPSKNSIKSHLHFYSSEVSSDYNRDSLDFITLSRSINSYESIVSPYSLGDLYLMRGGLLKQECRFSHAFDDFKRATDPKYDCNRRFDALLETATFLSLQGDHRGAINIFAEMEKKKEEYGPDQNWVNFYAKYSTMMLNVDMSESARLATLLVNQYPDSAEAHLVNGFVSQATGCTIYAINELQKSLEICPSVYGYITLAACYGSNGLKQSMEIMKKAISLDSKNADVLIAYGDLCQMEGQFLNAMNTFTKAIEICPEDPQGYLGMARLVMQANRKSDDALGWVKKALEKDEFSFAAYLMETQIYIVEGKSDEVKKSIEKAIAYATGEASLIEIYGLKAVFEESEKCEAILKETKAKKN